MSTSLSLPLSQRLILTEESYNFSQYFDLAFETGDILQELGYSFDTRALIKDTNTYSIPINLGALLLILYGIVERRNG
jgi:hypothetical protein